MPVRYYPAHGPELVVELWEEGRGFAMELCYEADYPLRDGSTEALTVGRAAMGDTPPWTSTIGFWVPWSTSAEPNRPL